MADQVRFGRCGRCVTTLLRLRQARSLSDLSEVHRGQQRMPAAAGQPPPQYLSGYAETSAASARPSLSLYFFRYDRMPAAAGQPPPLTIYPAGYAETSAASARPSRFASSGFILNLVPSLTSSVGPLS